MKIMADTNVMLDILIKRIDFYEDSREFINLCEANKFHVYFSASAVTDIYYILYRSLKDKEVALNKTKSLLNIVKIADVFESDIKTAFSSVIEDFEDAVVNSVAERIDCDYIVARNEKDFKNADIPVISPKDFLEIVKK